MIVAFMNMKGGVGKTTLCLNLAGASAYYGKRVLIVDYDPQFNLTQHLLEPNKYYSLQKEKKTIYNVLLPNVSNPNPFNINIDKERQDPPKVKDMECRLFKFNRRSWGEKYGHASLIPGSNELMYLVLGKKTKTVKPMEIRFHSFLEEAEKAFDLIFIDCHPAGSFLTKSALVMSDIIVTPVVPDSYSLRGLALMKEFIEYISKYSNRQLSLRIVFNMIPWQTADRRIEINIRNSKEFKNVCLNSMLHYSKAIATSGQVQGANWKRLMQWSKKPWTQRVRNDLSAIYKEIFEV